MTTKYWIGNGGNWSDTAHWSLSSGGSGGALVPDINDDIIFDSNSITLTDQAIIFSDTITINSITTEELLYNVKFQDITGIGALDICVNGTATDSIGGEEYPAENAFDGSLDTDWWVETSPAWLKYDLGDGVSKIAKSYTILAYDGDSYYPSSWTFEGSNNNIDWVVLDTQIDQIPYPKTKYSCSSNVNSYRYYRWNITGDGGGGPDITEAKIFEVDSDAIAWTLSSVTDVRLYNITLINSLNDGLVKYWVFIENDCINGGGNEGWEFGGRRCYWSGYSTTWDDEESTWSNSSGGEPNVNFIPRPGDYAIFDLNCRQDLGCGYDEFGIFSVYTHPFRQTDVAVFFRCDPGLSIYFSYTGIGTFTLIEDSVFSDIDMYDGSLDCNDYNLTINNYLYIGGGHGSAYFRSGTITVGSINSPWSYETGPALQIDNTSGTIDFGTATFIFNCYLIEGYTTPWYYHFYGDSLEINSLTINLLGNTCNYDSGNYNSTNLFKSFTVNNDGILDADGTTYISNSSGLTLEGDTSGGQQITGNYVMTSGTVNATNVTVTNSVASGGATFRVATNIGGIDGGGNTGWIFEELIILSITSFSPSSGYISDEITITGTGFIDITSVKIGDIDCEIKSYDSTEIVFYINHEAITDLISVSTESETVYSETPLIINQPTITLQDNLTCENLIVTHSFYSQEYKINSRGVLLNPLTSETIINIDNSDISCLIFQIDDANDYLQNNLLSNITIEEQL